MKDKIKHTLEELVILLIVFVIFLIIVGIITVGKRFVNSIQNNVEPLPNYEKHEPQYY